MRFTARRVAGLLALLALLAACDEVGTITRPFHLGERVQGAWDYAGSHGPILTEVHGNPFPEHGAETLAMRVVDRLAKSGQVRPTAYTMDPRQAFFPATRLVLLFGVNNVQADAVCAGRHAIGQDGIVGDDILLVLVMCSESLALAMTDGRIPRVDTLDDESFGWLISHSLQTMLRK